MSEKFCELPIAHQEKYLVKNDASKYHDFNSKLEDFEENLVFAGPLEIMAVAFAMETQIHVYEMKDGKFSKVQSYPENYFEKNAPLCLLHTMPTQVGEGSHYDVLAPKTLSSANSRQWPFLVSELTSIIEATIFEQWLEVNSKSGEQRFENPSLSFYDICRNPSTVVMVARH